MPKMRLRSGVPDRRPQACEGRKIVRRRQKSVLAVLRRSFKHEDFLVRRRRMQWCGIAPTFYSRIFYTEAQNAVMPESGPDFISRGFSLYGGAERSDAELAPTLYLGIFVRMRRMQSFGFI